MSIAVFGSINMDVTAYMHRLPKPGETLQGKEYKPVSYTHLTLPTKRIV